jgi:hypothetical protein
VYRLGKGTDRICFDESVLLSGCREGQRGGTQRIWHDRSISPGLCSSVKTSVMGRWRPSFNPIGSRPRMSSTMRNMLTVL